MTLGQLAQECMDATDGVWEDAARLMRQRLEEYPALWDEVIEPLIKRAIWYSVRMCSSGERHGILNEIQHQPSVDGLVAVAQRMLLDWPLRGGKRLRDATVGDLDVEIGWYSRLASHHRRMALFFEGVKKQIRDSQDTVGHVWSEEQLRVLMAEVRESG